LEVYGLRENTLTNSSTGSFRFTTNYNTKNLRYLLKAHFVSHDILNEENGRLDGVADAESLQEGRIFCDQVLE
jgi:hypothetical protein